MNRQVPLTNDDKDLLLTVYKKRRDIFSIAYTAMVIVAAFYAQRIDYRPRYSNHTIRWQQEKTDPIKISRAGMMFINLFFLESIIISTGVYFWVKRVYPLKKDADSGVKEMVPYMIMRKEYFPLTNQFYVALDDPKYLHHEMDQETYNQCQEGGFIYVYRGIKSKFVFEESGKYLIF